MEDGVLNVIQNGNITFQYDGEERTTKDIGKDNRKMIFVCFLAVFATITLFVALICLVPLEIPESPLLATVEMTGITMLLFGVIIGIAFLGYRIIFGDKFKRFRNNGIEYFLCYMLSAGWYNGELMLTSKFESYKAPNLLDFGKVMRSKLPGLEINDQSTKSNPIKVVITTLYDMGITKVTIVDDNPTENVADT